MSDFLRKAKQLEYLIDALPSSPPAPTAAAEGTQADDDDFRQLEDEMQQVNTEYLEALGQAGASRPSSRPSEPPPANTLADARSRRASCCPIDAYPLSSRVTTRPAPDEPTRRPRVAQLGPLDRRSDGGSFAGTTSSSSSMTSSLPPHLVVTASPASSSTALLALARRAVDCRAVDTLSRDTPSLVVPRRTLHRLFLVRAPLSYL